MVERETSLESCLLISMGTVECVCLTPAHINNLIYKTLWICFIFCARVLFDVCGWLGATMWVLGKNAGVSGRPASALNLWAALQTQETYIFVCFGF